jgi:hypothetical protein
MDINGVERSDECQSEKPLDEHFRNKFSSFQFNQERGKWKKWEILREGRDTTPCRSKRRKINFHKVFLSRSNMDTADTVRYAQTASFMENGEHHVAVMITNSTRKLLTLP